MSKRDPATKPQGESRYAKKVARKLGRGTIGPNWVWWSMPRRPEVRVPPIARHRYIYTGNEHWEAVPL